MKLRLVGSLIAAAFLAACASGASKYSPANPSSASDASFARPAAKGPTYAITLVLPEGKSAAEFRNHAAAAVASLRATTFVKTHKYVFVVNNSTCTMALSGSTASGCGVETTGTASYTAKKATFDFFSKAGGKGCLLATATYKGALSPGYPLPLTFKALNTKTCWK